MKSRHVALRSVAACFGFAAILGAARAAFAQNEPDGRAAIFGGAFFMMFLVVAVAFYIFAALAVQTIAVKTNTPNPWLAWIPVANILLILNIAKKPIWWIILFLIPLVNIVVSVLVWMGVAEARQKPSWWGILTIIPVLNLVAIAYLAWTD